MGVAGLRLRIDVRRKRSSLRAHTLKKLEEVAGGPLGVPYLR
jgi:hypothetical protein